jgi:DNA-binding IclR family transcriptional regulator
MSTESARPAASGDELDVAEGPGGVAESRQPEIMQGVQRAVAVLEFLAAQQDPIGPSEIARGVGLAKPVVVRALRTWQALGYVKGQAGAYEIGWRIFTLTRARGQAQEIHTMAKRYLVSLNEQSGETVQLAVRSGTSLTYVDKVDGRRNIRVFGEIGRTAPLHSTATGKALLAHARQDFLDQFLARPLETYTTVTMSQPGALLSDLQMTRARGYSINRGEWHADVGGVGAAIFNQAGETDAAFGISFPIGACDETRIRELGKMVRDAAEQMSRERGFILD